jgi:hypothetical protein
MAIRAREGVMQGKHVRGSLLAATLATMAAFATGCSMLNQELVRPPMAEKEKDAAAKGFTTLEEVALVYLYRPGTESSAIEGFVDNAAECALWAGTFFVIAVTPGTHKIDAVDASVLPHEAGSVYIKREWMEGPTFTTEPGKNYYFKISPAEYPQAKVELVANEAEAQADIRQCGLITSWKYINR